VLEPVGLENAKGIVSMTYFKDPEDPQWEADAAMKEYKAGLAEHEPKADPLDSFCAYGWAAASTMIEALKTMKEPTREALMEAVRNMDAEIPMLLPGVRVTTKGEEDGYPIQAVQIMQFNGENWELQGEVIESGAANE
jgi:branched-chain amino acid transport system substrate-binding protein